MPETSWFRAGFLHNLGTVASSAVDSRGNLLGNGGREQASSITRTSTAPRSSSENWLSQCGQTGRQGIAHQRILMMIAKQRSRARSKVSMECQMTGAILIPEQWWGRAYLRSPSTADRNLDRNRMTEPTDKQASRQSSMSDTLGGRSSNGTSCCVDRTSRERQTTQRKKYCCTNEEEKNGNRRR
jgi:hypothetical protein